jgi:hypothetical protein
MLVVLIKAFACLVVIFWSPWIVTPVLLLWFFLCAGKELLPLSGDADECCQWKVQTDKGWTLY